jgi:hypothetical protein
MDAEKHDDPDQKRDHDSAFSKSTASDTGFARSFGASRGGEQRDLRAIEAPSVIASAAKQSSRQRDNPSTRCAAPVV